MISLFIPPFVRIEIIFLVENIAEQFKYLLLLQQNLSSDMTDVHNPRYCLMFLATLLVPIEQC